MKIKVDEITIQKNGRIYVNVLVPKKMPGGTRFDGSKYKPYTYYSRYRIIIIKNKLYVQYHCINNGWDSYPDKNYDIIKKWWKLNKNKVIMNVIDDLRRI